MASVASQLIEEVTAHAQSDSLEDAREICADGTYFLNNPRTLFKNRRITQNKISFRHTNLLHFPGCAEPTLGTTINVIGNC